MKVNEWEGSYMEVVIQELFEAIEDKQSKNQEEIKMTWMKQLILLRDLAEKANKKVINSNGQKVKN